MGEKGAATESTESNQSKVPGSACRCNEFIPQPKENFFDQSSALRDGGRAVAAGCELLLNACGVAKLEVPQFAAYGCGCAHYQVELVRHAQNRIEP